MATTCLHMPNELLYEFVSWLVASHVDDLMAGSLALPSLSMPALWDPYPDAEDWDKRIAETLEKDVVNTAPNPIIPLFSVSFGMREIAMKVLSAALGIPLTADELIRLETKPWTVLHSVRLCFSNPHIIPPKTRQQALEYAAHSPLLKGYTSIGQTRAMHKVLWYRQQLLMSQHGSDWSTRVAALIRDFNTLHKAAVTVVSQSVQVSEGPFDYYVVGRAREDALSISASLVYKTSATMAKFIQATMQALDQQRISIGVPSTHEMEKLLLFVLQDMQRLEQAALELPTYIRSVTLVETLDEKERTLAYDVMNTICEYQPHPSNASGYKKCQDIARAYQEKIRPYL